MTTNISKDVTFQNFSKFLPIFFSIAAFFSSSVDPLAQESTDCGLTELCCYKIKTFEMHPLPLIWNFVLTGRPTGSSSFLYGFTNPNNVQISVGGWV